MSHNKIKVGTAEADRTGLISPDLNDLGNVSGSPSDGQVLKYTSSSSSWGPASEASISEIEYIFWGHGESENYNGSPATNLNATSTLYVYDSNGVNNISGATVSSTTSTGAGGGEWLDSVTLPAGTYRATITSLPSFSSSGYFAFSLYDGSNHRTSYGSVGASVNTYGAGGPIGTGVFTLTTSTTLTPRINAVSGSNTINTVANQGDAISTSTTLLIEKLA